MKTGSRALVQAGRACLLVAACWTSTSQEGAAQVSFTDATVAAGVDYDHVVDPQNAPCASGDPACMGDLITAGATVGDYNDDGCQDLFVTRFDATDLLFENQCDGTFVDVAGLVGITENVQSNGALFVDVDSDGDLDLYVVTMHTAAHLLYINDGAHLSNPGTRPMFTEEGVSRGASVEPDPTRPRQGMSITAGDFDRDGYVDLYTTEWSPAVSPVICGGTHARFLHNRGAFGPGHFDDATDATRTLMNSIDPGMLQVPLSFAPAFPDLDRDGWLDLAVVADSRSSQLFWNDGNGRFSTGTVPAMVGTDEFGMGSTFGDYDNDGDFDWFVTSIYEVGGIPERDGNRFYKNEGFRVFSDATDALGVRNGYWGWGAAFFDYDNDGDLDLGHTNGFPVEAPYLADPVRLWRNDSGSMIDVAATLGVTDTRDGRAFLTFDYDNDGDLDIFVTNHNEGPVLYRNDGGNDGDWLRVTARGTESVPSGRGARVEVITPGVTQARQLGLGSHFLGEGEMVAHFGLGAGFAAGGGVAHVRVRFPSGRIKFVSSVTPNTTIEIAEPTYGPRAYLRCEADATDCNDNGEVDVCDIASDPGLDLDQNGIIDACGSSLPDPPACIREQGCDVRGVPWQAPLGAVLLWLVVALGGLRRGGIGMPVLCVTIGLGWTSAVGCSGMPVGPCDETRQCTEEQCPSFCGASTEIVFAECNDRDVCECGCQGNGDRTCAIGASEGIYGIDHVNTTVECDGFGSDEGCRALCENECHAFGVLMARCVSSTGDDFVCQCGCGMCYFTG